jgi:hypothetical protein
MSKPDPKHAKERHEEIKDLLERCHTMETALAEIKERLASLQKSLHEKLHKRSGGSSMNPCPIRPLRTHARFEWSPHDKRLRPVPQVR